MMFKNVDLPAPILASKDSANRLPRDDPISELRPDDEDDEDVEDDDESKEDGDVAAIH
jgi:hypothetical protein